MSMPHTCRCDTCGHEMTWTGPDVLDQAQANGAAFDNGVRALAGAIIKIAPSAAQQIADRWRDIRGAEQKALDEFLTFLRSHS